MILCSPSPGTVASEMIILSCKVSARSKNLYSEPNLFPSRIGVELVCNPVAERGGKNIHEGCSGGNDIAIPGLLNDMFFDILLSLVPVLLRKHLPEFFLLLISFPRLLSGAESTRALLVHLGAGCDTI